MVTFVLDKAVPHIGTVREDEDLSHGTRDAHFLSEAASGSRSRAFPRVRMRAAAVGPQTAGMVLVAGAPLQKHSARRVENEYRHGPVEKTLTVRSGLARVAYGPARLVNKGDGDFSVNSPLFRFHRCVFLPGNEVQGNFALSRKNERYRSPRGMHRAFLSAGAPLRT
jgi:hypothetical protein